MALTTGTLTNSTPVVIGVSSFNIPFTVSLKSSSAGRLIRVSFDGGASYITPTMTHVDTNSMMCVINAPVTHVQFTGVANDTWSIL